MNEYHTEKFIEQYEHISRLKLLTDEELAHVKKKRAQFEVSIKSAKVNPKPFFEYIKYEIALMKKFKQIDYEDENDGRALDKAMSFHVKEIFRSALKRHPEKRKIWDHYITFAKQKFPTSVTAIYQELLHYHHNKEDYIEAVRHEMSRKNYNVAIGFLIQGISKEKDSKDLVVLHIECSLQQAENEDDEKIRESTLQQVSKFYAKFLKSSKEVKIHVDLIQRIQKFEFAMDLQNEILTNMLRGFRERAELWDILAKRHLDGLFYDENKEASSEKEKSLEICIRHALTIYDKSFEYVGEPFRKQMYNLYITKLLELEESTQVKKSFQCSKYIRQALGRVLMNGCKEDNLSEAHFIYCLKLRILYLEKYQAEIEEMLEKGPKLYANSMELYELAIKYYLECKDFDNITIIFKYAISNNEKNAVELYKFLCGLYMINPNDKDKAKTAMLEAVKSSDKSVSASFQPYVIEFYALTEGIAKAREMFNCIINSKAVTRLSIDFFKTMLKMEEVQATPDHKMMVICYERATEHFGKNDPEIWIDYIKYLWQKGKYTDANSLRQRAIEMMKNDLSKVEDFEFKFTILKNELGMLDDVKLEDDEEEI